MPLALLASAELLAGTGWKTEAERAWSSEGVVCARTGVEAGVWLGPEGRVVAAQPATTTKRLATAAVVKAVVMTTRLRHQSVGVEHELPGHALVEVLVTCPSTHSPALCVGLGLVEPQRQLRAYRKHKAAGVQLSHLGTGREARR